MQKKLLTEADGYIAHKRRRQAWKKVVSVLACIVVFCTTYAPDFTCYYLGNWKKI